MANFNNKVSINKEVPFFVRPPVQKSQYVKPRSSSYRAVVRENDAYLSEYLKNPIFNKVIDVLEGSSKPEDIVAVLYSICKSEIK